MESNEVATTVAGRVEPVSGPVFISGRQYSGNTLVTSIIQRIPGCFAIRNEGEFFERRYVFDHIADDAERARCVVNNLKLSDEQLTTQAGEWLTSWVRAHPQADALAIYRETMRFLTETTGNQFWAQKATSYVFHAREILISMPDARMVYLMRNPYDLCASSKRRLAEVESVVGRTLGWNAGVKMLERADRQLPGRIHMLKYEDLVTDSQRPVQALCEFLGVSFSADLLDVPHVNPSENQFKVVEGSKGINKSRLFYYIDELPKSEVAAVGMLASTELLDKYYPDLPHRSDRVGSGARLVAVWRIIFGLFCYAVDRVRWARKMNISLVRRTCRRLMALRS